jgi:DNA-binding XRE family transcriptional regulator
MVRRSVTSSRRLPVVDAGEVDGDDPPRGVVEVPASPRARTHGRRGGSGGVGWRRGGGGAGVTLLAHRFALDPTPAQERALRSHCGAARFAFNWEQVRAKRPPDEDMVAEYRARLDAEVRAYRLREIREEQGLTQVELAERMHVKQPSISELERDGLDRAGLSTIRAYVEALGGKIEVIADFGDRRVVLG